MAPKASSQWGPLLIPIKSDAGFDAGEVDACTDRKARRAIP